MDFHVLIAQCGHSLVEFLVSILKKLAPGIDMVELITILVVVKLVFYNAVGPG